MVEPRATYRLQLRPGFGFAEAADLVPYLAGLGVSHLYASPCLEARAGSQHGYDVTDPTRVREELGGAAGLEALVTALRRQGMALLLDIVPNHMAADPAANPWWRDVLEDGRRSPFAAVFDIDWDVPDAELHGRVLAPLLTDGVAAVAGRAELSVVRCRRGLSLRYRDHDLPLAPATVHAILTEAAAGGGASLAAAATAYGDLPDATAGYPEAARQRHAARLDAAATLARSVVAELQRLRQGLQVTVGFVDNHRRPVGPVSQFTDRGRVEGNVAMERLFDEDQEVFDLTHGLVVDLCRSGVAGGLRVDHVDGLRDPARYLRRLRERTGASWLVVEKILGWDERLPEDWAVDGTTGYEFGALITALFTNPDGVVALDAVAAEVTGEMPDVAGTLMRAKREVMAGELAADVARVARLLEAGAASTRAAAPGGRPAADQVSALVAVAAGLPVYRTYVDPATGRARPEDRAAIAAAVTAARRHVPGVDLGAVEAIGGLLSEPREARAQWLAQGEQDFPSSGNRERPPSWRPRLRPLAPSLTRAGTAGPASIPE